MNEIKQTSPRLVIQLIIKIRTHMKKILFILVCMFAAINVNGQNAVFDEIIEQEQKNQPTKGYGQLTLSPQKSIKENYEIINDLISQHKERDFDEYTIRVDGHYTNSNNEYYDTHIGLINIKGERIFLFEKIIVDKFTISNDIVNVLTELYSNTLGESFHYKGINFRTVKVKGDKTNKFPYDSFYTLTRTSKIREKMCNKVKLELGLIIE